MINRVALLGRTAPKAPLGGRERCNGDAMSPVSRVNASVDLFWMEVCKICAGIDNKGLGKRGLPSMIATQKVR